MGLEVMNAGKMESAGNMGLEMHERRKDGSGDA